MSHVLAHYLLLCLFQTNASKHDNEFRHPLSLAMAQLGLRRPGPAITVTARMINYELKMSQQFIKFRRII